MPSPVRCTFVSPGVNDTYQVIAGENTFFWRVYRAGLRSQPDIEWEMELLLHLQQSGVSVAVPVPKADGSYITALVAPEGVRPAVLFTSAPGKVLDYVPDDGFRYGCSVANLHNAMDEFQPRCSRFRLDLDHLLEHPLRLIRPFADEMGLWGSYSALAGRLRSQVEAVQPELEQGICHGDLHGHNVHKDGDGQMTFFDFDCGGPGFRAYDLAVYRWAVGRHARNLEPWDAFVAGYRTVRQIRPADMAVIPAFEMIRIYWLLGLQVQQVHQRGTDWVRMWLEGALPALQKLDTQA